MGARSVPTEGSRTVNREVKELLRALLEQGWKHEGTSGSGHVKVRSPEGQAAFLPSSPSDWRSLKNKVAVLRRMGADV